MQQFAPVWATILFWDSDCSNIDESKLTPAEVQQLRANYSANLLETEKIILSHTPRLAVAGPEHGFHSGKGPHAGDMPNLIVPESGVLKQQIFTPGVTLGAGENSLFDADGSAFVIHAKGDDYRSQPAGDSGDRIACAVITK